MNSKFISSSSPTPPTAHGSMAFGGCLDNSVLKLFPEGIIFSLDYFRHSLNPNFSLSVIIFNYLEFFFHGSIFNRFLSAYAGKLY